MDDRDDLDLSEQALIDCDKTNACAEGAQMEIYENLFFSKLKGRVLPESKYEYHGNKTADCPVHANWYNPGAEVEDIYYSNKCNEDLLKRMVIFYLILNVYFCIIKFTLVKFKDYNFVFDFNISCEWTRKVLYQF